MTQQISGKANIKNLKNAVDILEFAHLVKSRSEAKRLVKEGAVEIDGIVIRDPQKLIEFKNGMIIKVGKHRFAKLEL